MARYTGSVCRLCRREGCKLFLKGDKCYGANCAFSKRQTPPGEHGQARQRKMSEYGMQLREKQKAKRAYGVLEKQFHGYFDIASNQKGITGENLLIMLEKRLDNVVYRAGFGASRAMARQLVLHGHVRVNGKKAESEYFKTLREGTNRVIPKWLELDSANLKATIVSSPARDDIDLTIQENLIVELYSR